MLDGTLSPDGSVRFDKPAEWSRDTLRLAGDWKVRAVLGASPDGDGKWVGSLTVVRPPGGDLTTEGTPP